MGYSMKPRTKRQQRERAEAWELALAEGRVIKYFDRLVSYPTIEATREALADALAAEMPAEIVHVS